jgi:hypothetical protein
MGEFPPHRFTTITQRPVIKPKYVFAPFAGGDIAGIATIFAVPAFPIALAGVTMITPHKNIPAQSKSWY